MKRGLGGRTRRGSPPLPRQRKALRVVQATLLGVAVVLALLAVRAWDGHRRPGPAASVGSPPPVSLGEVAALGAAAVAFAGAALAMGGRTVRGPEPPRLD